MDDEYEVEIEKPKKARKKTKRSIEVIFLAIPSS